VSGIPDRASIHRVVQKKELLYTEDELGTPDNIWDTSRPKRSLPLWGTRLELFFGQRPPNPFGDATGDALILIESHVSKYILLYLFTRFKYYVSERVTLLVHLIQKLTIEQNPNFSFGSGFKEK
jgi:hypothetical protein